MPGKVGVKIKAARNLPVMDKSSETTDAFVEIKLANKEHKTEVFRKSLNPTWNTDWYVPTPPALYPASFIIFGCYAGFALK